MDILQDIVYLWGQRGPKFIKLDWLNAWTKNQLILTLLSTILMLQLPNFCVMSWGLSFPHVPTKALHLHLNNKYDIAHKIDAIELI